MELPAADSSPSEQELDELAAQLTRRGWLPAAASATGISSPGAGNMNRVLRVHLRNAPRPSLILKQSLPVVAKYPDIPAPVARDQSEAAFYDAVAANANLAKQMPALVGHDSQAHLLCFEDLGSGADFTSLYADNGSPNSLAPLVEWLGQLHQQPIPRQFPSNSRMRQLNHEHIFVLPFQAHNAMADFPEVTAWQQQFCARANALHQIQQLGELYLTPVTATTEQPADRAAPALLHGDFYPGSWVRGEKGVPQVIDPEFAFVGPPEFDVGVLLAHLTFANVAPAHQQHLLQHYAEPANFSLPLAHAFAGVEILRRLLGVAKLPLSANAEQQLQWLARADELLQPWLANHH